MRQPKPWFRSSLSAWYVEHHGKQVRLGDHPDGAPAPKKTKGSWNPPPAILDAFYKVMASDGEPAEATPDGRGLRPLPRALRAAQRAGHVRLVPALPPELQHVVRSNPRFRVEAVPRHPVA
jgi:hypothetical protein